MNPSIDPLTDEHGHAAYLQGHRESLLAFAAGELPCEVLAARADEPRGVR